MTFRTLIRSEKSPFQFFLSKGPRITVRPTGHHVWHIFEPIRIKHFREENPLMWILSAVSLTAVERPRSPYMEKTSPFCKPAVLSGFSSEFVG